MNIAVLVCRIVLGLAFIVAGASSFFFLSTPPPSPPGLPTAFMNVFFESRWVLFVGVIQCLAGVLLLMNRYVPLALTMLGAVLYNIFAYHLTMMPSGLPLPIVVLALWIVVASRYRSSFAPLLAPTVDATRLPPD